MLRSHHLCCMAIHIEKTCEVCSFGDAGGCVPGVWRRCRLLYGVIALDSDALLCLVLGPLCWWIAGVPVISVGKEEV